jgi:hypothetical protein
MIDASEINALLMADHGESFRYTDRTFTAVIVIGTSRLEENAPAGIDVANTASLSVLAATGIELQERDRVTRIADTTDWTVTHRQPTESGLYKCTITRHRAVTKGRL